MWRIVWKGREICCLQWRQISNITLCLKEKDNFKLGRRRRRGFNFYDYHFVRTTTFSFFMKKKREVLILLGIRQKDWSLFGWLSDMMVKENKTLRKENYHYYSILYLASKQFYSGKAFRVYNCEEFKPPEHYSWEPANVVLLYSQQNRRYSKTSSRIFFINLSFIQQPSTD